MYVADPEGNIVELQAWALRPRRARRGSWRSLAALLALALPAMGCGSVSDAGGPSPDAAGAAARAGDAALARAFDDRASGLEVEGAGTVERLLADDEEGSRHQRFILRLASGQTLLVAHNIDVAPRIAGLRVGDVVAFRGVYEWSDRAGRSTGRITTRRATTPPAGCGTAGERTSECARGRRAGPAVTSRHPAAAGLRCRRPRQPVEF